MRGAEGSVCWDPPISLQCAAHQVLLMRGAEGCVCWDPPFGLKSKCCPPGTAEMRRGESGGRGGGRDGLSAVCVWPAVQRMHGAACMGTHCASPGASCLVMPVASAPTLAANDPTSPIMYACPPCLMRMCQYLALASASPLRPSIPWPPPTHFPQQAFPLERTCADPLLAFRPPICAATAARSCTRKRRAGRWSKQPGPAQIKVVKGTEGGGQYRRYRQSGARRVCLVCWEVAQATGASTKKGVMIVGQ